jgi:hypothetical protein
LGLNLSLVKKLFFLSRRPPEKIMGAPERISALIFVLARAVRHRIERIDTPIAPMFLRQRNALADDGDIMKTLSLIGFVPTKLRHWWEWLDHSTSLKFREGRLTVNFFWPDRFVEIIGANCEGEFTSR